MRRWFPRLTRGHSFFWVAKRKKPKKRRPRADAPPAAGFPALLVRPGGCGTRGFAPQTVLADYPRPHSVARRRPKGANTERNLMRTEHAVRSVFLLPFASSSSAGRNGKKGEDCLRTEGPSSAALPLRLSSAEHPAKPGDAAGAPSSWVLLLDKTRRSTSPAGETRHLNPLPPRSKPKPARQVRNPASPQ